MAQFIFTNLLMVSLGIILYLGARTLPRIDEEKKEEKRNLLERLVMSEIPQKVDRALNAAAGKFFRKMKIYLLRVDNYLTTRLKRINTEEGLNGQKRPGVMEIRTPDYAGPDRREGERRKNLLEEPPQTPSEPRA